MSGGTAILTRGSSALLSVYGFTDDVSNLTENPALLYEARLPESTRVDD